MAMALVHTSEGLEKALATEALKPDLAETRLEKAASWLRTLSSSAAQLLLGHLLDAKRTHTAAHKKLEAINMPAISDEATYRKSGVRNVGNLADLSGAVEKDIKRLKDLRQALSKLKSCKFGSEGDSPGLTCINKFQENNGWYPLDPVPGEADSLLTCSESSFHVAAVAAMCLLRNESIQGGTPDPKAVKQLGDITATLKLKFNLLPERNGDLRKHGAALLAECESTAKGKKRKGDATEDPAMTRFAKAPAKDEKEAKKPTAAQAVEEAEKTTAAQAVLESAASEKSAANASAAALSVEADSGGVDDEPKKDEKAEDQEQGEKKKDKKEKKKDKKEKHKDKKEKKENKDKKHKEKKEKPDQDKSEKKAKKKEKKDRAQEKTDEQKLSKTLRKKLWNSPRKRKSKDAESVDEDTVVPESDAKALPKAKPKAKAGPGQGRGRGRGRGRK
eukprot:s662_g21.t1